VFFRCVGFFLFFFFFFFFWFWGLAVWFCFFFGRPPKSCAGFSLFYARPEMTSLLLPFYNPPKLSLRGKCAPAFIFPLRERNHLVLPASFFFTSLLALPLLHSSKKNWRSRLSSLNLIACAQRPLLTPSGPVGAGVVETLSPCQMLFFSSFGAAIFPMGLASFGVR